MGVFINLDNRKTVSTCLRVEVVDIEKTIQVNKGKGLSNVLMIPDPHSPSRPGLQRAQCSVLEVVLLLLAEAMRPGSGPEAGCRFLTAPSLSPARILTLPLPRHYRPLSRRVSDVGTVAV